MPPKPDKIYGGRAEVEEIIGKNKLPKNNATLRLWEKKGFPAPIKLGHRTQVWPLEEIRAYVVALQKGKRHA